MIELVFVIVIVGILSSVISSSFERNTLREAADQVVSHIRYTQHLAMVDDKFVPNPEMSKESTQARKSKHAQEWFRGRWQIRFHRTVDTAVVWSYSIFSDTLGTVSYGGEPDEGELAKSPQNPQQYLTGGFSGGVVGLDSPQRVKRMALGEKYGIDAIVFSPSCTNNQGINQSRRISFDYIGRPFQSDLSNTASWTKPYQSDKIIQSPCNIVLSSGNRSITITIEPETGHTYISSQTF